MRKSGGFQTWAAVTAAALLCVCSVNAAPLPSPFQSNIDRAAIARAIELVRSANPARLQRFHEDYNIRLDDPVIERLEVITEFRRVVIASEGKARLGDITWGPDQAEAMLRPFRGTVSLVLHVALSPQNVYSTLPRFDLAIFGRPGQRARIDPVSRQETPRYVSGQLAPPGSPVLGGSIEGIFQAGSIDRLGTYLVGIFQQGRELRRVEVDFGRIE